MKDYDYQQLNDLIHSRIRLAILSVLVDLGEKEFPELKNLIKTTDGNLSVNLKKLQTGDLITVEKEFKKINR